MPAPTESWSDYLKRLAAGKIGIAAAYALKGDKKKGKSKRKVKAPRPPAPTVKESMGRLDKRRRRIEEEAKRFKGKSNAKRY